MEKLAALPNVTVKISGLAMPILGWGYHEADPPHADGVAEDLAPLVNFLVDAFGADRCMFASNFPVDKASMPFHGTAHRVYRL